MTSRSGDRRHRGRHPCVRAARVDPAGEVITHVIIAFFDITARSRRAGEGREEQRSTSRSGSRRSDARRGIAHDFNNLIFGIKLIAADLAVEETDPKRRAALALIDDITERSARSRARCSGSRAAASTARWRSGCRTSWRRWRSCCGGRPRARSSSSSSGA